MNLDELQRVAEAATPGDRNAKTRAPTAEVVRARLLYDEETGIFRWKIGKPGISAGTVAGDVGNDGRHHICINYRRYIAHRLAWLYVYGEWPSGEIDHINGDPLDNRIQNLRVVSGIENKQSVLKPSMNNKLGLRGVYFRKGHGYISRIRAHGKYHHLGTFKSAEAAHAAYLSAKLALHPCSREAIAVQHPDALRKSLEGVKL